MGATTEWIFSGLVMILTKQAAAEVRVGRRGIAGESADVTAKSVSMGTGREGILVIIGKTVVVEISVGSFHSSSRGQSKCLGR